MVEQDTIKLLRECDAGVRMGISSIDEVRDYARDPQLREKLTSSRNENDTIKNEIQNLLFEYHDTGKEPNPMAKGMSWVKTNVMLGVSGSDQTIADLITDGCNMGVKSLYRYLNEYKAADQRSKDLTGSLISAEERLASDMRQFL